MHFYLSLSLTVKRNEFKSNWTTTATAETAAATTTTTSTIAAAAALMALQTRQKPLEKLPQNEPNNSSTNNTNRTEQLGRSFFFFAQQLRLKRSAFTIRLNYSRISVVKSDEKPARNDSKQQQRPVFASHRKFEKLSFDPTQYECVDKHSMVCLNKTNEFRARILSEFGKSLHESINDSTTATVNNIYNVEYEHPDDIIKYNPTCMVLDAKLRILTNKDAPFDTNKIGRLFPKRKLFGKKYLSVPRSCIIVSSSGALHQSGLGKFIGKLFNCYCFREHLRFRILS